MAKKFQLKERGTNIDIYPITTKEAVGLDNVDNTSDVNKPISSAQQVALNNKVDKVIGKGLSTNDYTTEEKTKLDGIAAGAQVNTVNSVAGKTGAVSLVKSDVGLGNVDNTSDANKPISTAQATKFSEIDTKLNKLHGSVIALTQSQYDALTTKDSETLYIVD